MTKINTYKELSKRIELMQKMHSQLLMDLQNIHAWDPIIIDTLYESNYSLYKIQSIIEYFEQDANEIEMYKQSSQRYLTPQERYLTPEDELDTPMDKEELERLENFSYFNKHTDIADDLNASFQGDPLI